MKTLIQYLKYSGLWFGFILNPYHWRFGWNRDNEMIMSNTVHFGPFWITLIIDDGRW